MTLQLFNYLMHYLSLHSSQYLEVCQVCRDAYMVEQLEL